MKVLLIDDHPLILAALQAVIQELGDDVSVVGAATARIGREKLKSEKDFDLILLDLNLGDTDGIDVLTEFRATYPALPVVVVSASDRYSDVIRAVDAGAMGFVQKRSSTAELHEALRLVMSGGIFIPTGARALMTNLPPPMGNAAQVTTFAETTPMIHHIGRPSAQDTGFHSGLPEAPAPPPLATLGLTPRQNEVLALLLQGKPNKLIARELNVSVDTVKDHVAAVLRALNVTSRTQAVLAVAEMSQRGALTEWRATKR
ncbi:MAG: response regulator transcription factor [Burkholderiaceae bacterium]